MLPGQKIADIRNRLGDLRSYSAMRAKLPITPRMLRPNLPGSLSITKIPKDVKRPSDVNSRLPTSVDDEPQVLDSDDEDDSNRKFIQSRIIQDNSHTNDRAADSTKKVPDDSNKISEKENYKNDISEPLVLTTDEKLPPEDALEVKAPENENILEPMNLQTKLQDDAPMNLVSRTSSKINLLKNYRHQRPGVRHQNESSLSQLERTTSAFSKDGIPDFRKNLDDITQSYSPGPEEKSSSRKKKSPNKIDVSETHNDRQANMTHSVSSLLGPNKSRLVENMVSSTQNRIPTASNMAGLPQDVYMSNKVPMANMGHTMLASTSPLSNEGPISGPQPTNVIPNPLPTSSQTYSSNPPPEAPYGQYPGIYIFFIVFIIFFFTSTLVLHIDILIKGTKNKFIILCMLFFFKLSLYSFGIIS